MGRDSESSGELHYKFLKAELFGKWLMSGVLSLDDLVRGFRWLGHGVGFTELAAFDPAYRPGRENYGWNRERDAFPRFEFTRDEVVVAGFVERWAGERLVCWGLNPRRGVLRNRGGFVRSALESDIEVSLRLLLDLDFSGGVVDESGFGRFLKDRVDAYFQDRGFLAPVRAFSGGGCHLLVAYPGVPVGEVPDVAGRQKFFRDEFYGEFRGDLERLDVRLDSTQDLRRLVKVWGTAKPGGVLSSFYGGRRVEDAAFRDYLLGLEMRREQEQVSGSLVLGVGQELPGWFRGLLESDRVTRDLWLGWGKPNGLDTSRSGYDYSLARSLLSRGYTDVSELATILALRPEGAVRRSGKNEGYVARTIGAALVR